MAIDIAQIQLSDANRRLLAEIAEATGKPWSEVLNAVLDEFRRQEPAKPVPSGRTTESVYDRLKASGLLGCLEGGPSDLSTNPAYMEGFGADDR